MISATLNEICTVITDGAHASPKSVDVGYPMGSVKDMTSSGMNYESCRRISFEDFKKLEHLNCSPQVGDILFSKDGAKAAETVCLHTNEEPLVLLSSVAILRPDLSKVVPKFLELYLRNPKTIKMIRKGFLTGAAIPRIVCADIKRIRVDIPPLAEQNIVVNRLEIFDNLIENNQRRIEILEEMARLLYQEWFVHFRFPGHENVKMVDSELGPIPEGWEVKKLADIATTQYGYTESANQEMVGPRYLRGKDINKKSFINWSDVPFCPISDQELAKFRVKVGDIFVIRMADPGKVGICEVEVDAVFASYLVRIRPATKDLLPYYLFYVLSDKSYFSWVAGASTGSTRKSVSAKVMCEYSLAVPPERVQTKFVERVLPLRKLLNNLIKQNNVLREARDLLLPRLISGQLDVSELNLSETDVSSATISV